MRGSHAKRVTISQSTERVMYFAYFGGLADDMTLYPAEHRNSNSSFDSNKESHRLLMKHLVIESRCCAGADSKKSPTSTEYALPDAFVCFRNVHALVLIKTMKMKVRRITNRLHWVLKTSLPCSMSLRKLEVQHNSPTKLVPVINARGQMTFATTLKNRSLALLV